jgi:alpha-glucosidase
LKADIFLKKADGSVFKGRVWPGVAVFPDWFHSNTQQYWDDEFASFFNPKSGVDIDALWIDMNEPSNFCDYPCDNPEAKTDQDAKSLKASDRPPKGTPETKEALGEEKFTHSPRKKISMRVNDRAKFESRKLAENQTRGDKKVFQDAISSTRHIKSRTN